ncbi:NAC domain [Dillenia turbinata]|uniref:NAC domain n=1 Tax=Dillenia turbinata TaxID=194707 RepID=A0AAN8VDR2_9MAGN
MPPHPTQEEDQRSIINNQPITMSQPSQDDLIYFDTLPPGYRFKPTESELITHYLKRKVFHLPLPRNKIISEDIYKWMPNQLLEHYKHVWPENEGYFFTPRERKYPNGQRPNRRAIEGFWKATGADRVITCEDIKGYKKGLVYYIGKALHGTKTDWIMHEYRLDQTMIPPKSRSSGDMRLDDFVLCKIYKKPHEKVTEEPKKRLKLEKGDAELGESPSSIVSDNHSTSLNVTNENTVNVPNPPESHLQYIANENTINIPNPPESQLQYNANENTTNITHPLESHLQYITGENMINVTNSLQLHLQHNCSTLVPAPVPAPEPVPAPASAPAPTNLNSTSQLGNRYAFSIRPLCYTFTAPGPHSSNPMLQYVSNEEYQHLQSSWEFDGGNIFAGRNHFSPWDQCSNASGFKFDHQKQP